MYTILKNLLILAVLLLAGTAAMLVYRVPYGWLIALAVTAYLLRKKAAFWAYGTAQWASYGDLARAGLIGGNGLGVGLIECDLTRVEGIKALFDKHLPAKQAVEMCLSAFQGKLKKSRQMVRLNNSHHVSVFAPTGAGKNVSIVEPFLFGSRESAIVIDVKGENANLTGAYRERWFGQKIIRLDPWKLTTDAPSCWNVLELIDPADPEALAQIRGLAEAMAEKNPFGERDPHWPQRAQVFITGVMAAVVFCCEPGDRNLPTVAKILANKVLLDKAIADLCNCPAHGGLVAQIGHEMEVSISRLGDGSWSGDNRELNSILSTVSRFLTFLGTPAVAESTRETKNCDLDDLYRGNGATIYLIIPLHYLSSHAPLLRLWITALVQYVVKRGINKQRPVNVILDECATALEGHGKAVEQMLAVGRGYGLKVVGIFQTLAQLGKLFPPGQEGILLSNTAQVFFGANDLQACDHISTKLGERTIVVTSGGKSTSSSTSHSGSNQGGSHSTSHSTSTNENWNQAGRKLLKPEEVANLDERTALIFTPGMRPIATFLPRFYEPPVAIGMSLQKMWTDAACLFLAAAGAAAICTALLFPEVKGWINGQREQGVYQPGETWPGDYPPGGR